MTAAGPALRPRGRRGHGLFLHWISNHEGKIRHDISVAVAETKNSGLIHSGRGFRIVGFNFAAREEQNYFCHAEDSTPGRVPQGMLRACGTSNCFSGCWPRAFRRGYRPGSSATPGTSRRGSKNYRSTRRRPVQWREFFRGFVSDKIAYNQKFRR